MGFILGKIHAQFVQPVDTFQQGAHFRRCGVENLGSELQRRGITRHDGWGAAGIVYVPLNLFCRKGFADFHRKYLTSIADLKTPTPTKGPSFSCDVAVQTEVVPVTYGQPLHMQTHTDDIQDDDSEESSLSASDLASILKWSKDISSDINLSSGNHDHFAVEYHADQLVLQPCEG